MEHKSLIIHEKEARDILGLPLQRRAHALLNLDSPGDTVPFMPPEELFLTIKESEDSEIVSLLEYMSGEQINFIFDIDLWVEDALNMEKFKKWMQYLSILEYDTLSRHLKKINLELVALGFSFSVIVLFPVGEEDHRVFEGDTLDGIYFFQFKEEWARIPFLKLLNIIKAEFGNLYYSFLINIFGGIPKEVEYEENRLRNVRLGSFGFPDYETAIQIYKGLSYKELLREYKKDFSRDLMQYKENRISYGYSSIIPEYPDIYKKDDSIFDRIFNFLDDKTKDEIRLEIAYLANCILVADNVKDINGIEIKDAVLKVKSHISLAIDILMDNSAEKGMDILNTYYLKSLFRFAYYQIKKLRSDARELIKTGIFCEFENTDDIYGFLTHEIGRSLRGLLYPHPLFYDNTSDDGNNVFRNFDSVNDINISRDCLMGIVYCEYIFKELFNISNKDLAEFYYKTRSNIHITFSTLLFRILWNNEPVLKSFTREELCEFINNIKKDKKIFTEFKAKIIEYFEENLKDFHKNRTAKSIIHDSIKGFYEEIREISIISPMEVSFAISSIAYD